MDRLIEDYEKALTEEFELRDQLEKLATELKFIEAEAWAYRTTAEPKLPQWKAQPLVLMALDATPIYKKVRLEANDVEYHHQKAKIKLAVVTERLKLTRARLYGGHHEMLDMQEVEQAPDSIVD